MLDRNLAFIDTETTSLKPSAELLEVAVIKVDPLSLEVKEEWSIKVKPQDISKADPDSLRINRYNEKDWADAVSPEVGLKIFCEKAKDCILVGHNIQWDMLWIRNNLEKNRIEPTFHYQSIDTISLSYSKLFKKLGGTDLPYLHLDYLVNYFGLKWDERHRALSDARVTYQVFLKLMTL